MIFLAQLIVLQAGYELCRRRGWLHCNDLRSLAGPYDWAGVLRVLDEKGWVESRLANTVGESGPTPLYRISRAGMNAAARRIGESAPVVQLCPDCGHSGVYLSNGPRWALTILRERYPDWRHVKAIHDSTERWNASEKTPYRFVFASDLSALVSAGFAECSGDGPALVYRVSELGCTATVLQWHGYDPEAAIFTEHGGRPLLSPPLGIAFFGSGN